MRFIGRALPGMLKDLRSVSSNTWGDGDTESKTILIYSEVSPSIYSSYIPHRISGGNSYVINAEKKIFLLCCKQKDK